MAKPLDRRLSSARFIIPEPLKQVKHLLNSPGGCRGGKMGTLARDTTWGNAKLEPISELVPQPGFKLRQDEQLWAGAVEGVNVGFRTMVDHWLTQAASNILALISPQALSILAMLLPAILVSINLNVHVGGPISHKSVNCPRKVWAKMNIYQLVILGKSILIGHLTYVLANIVNYVLANT
ncbi:hypothetical protein BJ138DRAFT_1108083, partial [Hygrophoropsis aurantiaca]